MNRDRPVAPLLAIKQAVPPVRPGTVRRDALEQRLTGGGGRLTLVVAPAGWGKTTLLSSWLDGLDPAIRVAWVSLDEGDDEPLRFWRYLITAVRSVSDAAGSAALQRLLSPGTDPLEEAVPTLLNDLTGSPERYVVVLDDFHTLRNGELHEQVEYFVSYLPPNVRLVLAGRQDPPLPVARLRARGQLTELRADDLRFDRSDAAAMLTALVAAPIDDRLADDALARSEGWAAGLQLTGLALRGRTEGVRRQDAPEPDRYVLDYFAAEVLPELTAAESDLLVATSGLERLSGALCDVALDTTGSAAVLDRLERACLFVTTLDGRREWYRCHQLFRQALVHAAPAAAATDRQLVVLRRAAGWFVDHGLQDEAVHCLLRAGDGPGAASLLATQQNWFFDHGLTGSYLALGDALPSSPVGPGLALGLAYAAEACGRRDRIGPWLDACEAVLDAGPPPAGWRDSRAALLMMRGLIGTPADRTTEALALIRTAVDLERAAGESEPRTALLALGAALERDGQFEPAVDVLTRLWDARDHSGWSDGVVLQLAGLLGFALLRLGRSTEVELLLRDALPLASRADAEWRVADSSAAMLRLVQARSAYLQGRHTQARDLLVRAGDAGGASRVATQVVRRVFLADAELACGSRADARAALAEAREIADNEAINPPVRAMLEHAENRLGRGAARTAIRSGALVEPLTDRELTILRALAGSASRREIGAALYLSINTIKAYSKSLYRKLGVNSRSAAVATGRELGLI